MTAAEKAANQEAIEAAKGDTESLAEELAPLGLTTGYRFEMVPPDKLHEHPKNANRGDVNAIGQSLTANGFYGVVVAQASTGYILVGNHRYRESVAKGLPLVPTVWVDVDAVEAIRILLADNEIARRARIDIAAQDALIEELRVVDPELKGTGFDRALEQLAEDEAADEADKEEQTDEGGDDGEPEYPEFGTQYGVIVICKDEADQASVYQRLAAMELGELRVVAV
jgi:hypothetical protein